MTVISRAPKLAFVQGHRFGDLRRNYLSNSCETVARALKNLGYDVRPFNREHLPAKYRVTPHTPVKGDAGCVKFLYERAFPGVVYPNFDVPKELEPFARRKITYTTLGKLRARHNSKPFPYGEKFVKPSVHAKLFAARDANYAAWGLTTYPDSTPISVQDYRSFRDEVRFMVSPWTGPKNLSFYDEDKSRDWQDTLKTLQELAHTIWETWKPTGPKCYVLDVGMSSKSGADRYFPTLVEINSVLTAGNLDDIKPQRTHPGKLVATGWESYARYAETGRF